MIRTSAFLLIASFVFSSAALFGANEYSNRRAPGFSLPDSHFVQHDPQDYRGKVLLVDFIQTTCPICKQLTETLLQVKSKYGDRIGIFSIVTLPDDFGKVDRFTAEHNVTWPIMFDSGQVMASYLKVTPANPKVSFPHLFIVDGSGTIRYDSEGAEDESVIAGQIDKLMK